MARETAVALDSNFKLLSMSRILVAVEKIVASCYNRDQTWLCVYCWCQTPSGVVSPRGETTPSGVWHQQYTHNHVWSLKPIVTVLMLCSAPVGMHAHFHRNRFGFTPAWNKTYQLSFIWIRYLWFIATFPLYFCATTQVLIISTKTLFTFKGCTLNECGCVCAHISLKRDSHSIWTFWVIFRDVII